MTDDHDANVRRSREQRRAWGFGALGVLVLGLGIGAAVLPAATIAGAPHAASAEVQQLVDTAVVPGAAVSTPAAGKVLPPDGHHASVLAQHLGSQQNIVEVHYHLLGPARQRPGALVVQPKVWLAAGSANPGAAPAADPPVVPATTGAF
jgi:hypothetical protein